MVYIYECTIIHKNITKKTTKRMKYYLHVNKISAINFKNTSA